MIKIPMTTFTTKALLVAAVFAVGANASVAVASEPKPAEPPSPQGKIAHADLETVGGVSVGHVRLTETPQGIILRARVSMLPQGTHGFHIHTVGRCDAETGFDSAGGHLNPTGHHHGFASGQGQHAGDLPNLEIPDESKVEVTYFLPGLTIGDGDTVLLDGDGASLVIHGDGDDYRTDPSGAAGPRIACGVIEEGAEAGADPLAQR